MNFEVERLDLVGLYGAVLATISFCWHIINRWKEKPSLKITIFPRAMDITKQIQEEVVFVSINNSGKENTALIVMGFRFYKNSLQKFRKKDSRKTLIINKPLIAYTDYRYHSLEQNKPWVAGLEYTKKLEGEAKGDLVFLEVGHSASKQPSLIKVNFSDKIKYVNLYAKP